MKKWLAAFLLVVVTAALAACGGGDDKSGSSTVEKVKEAKTLVIGTNAGYYPFEMFDKDGKMIGYDVDVAQAIADKMGAKLEVKQLGFDSLIPALQADKVDLVLAGMTITDERKNAVDFADSYYTTGQTVMVAADSTAKALEDIDKKGNKIAVQIGTTGAIVAKDKVKNATVQEFEDFPTAALAAQQGKVAGVIYDEPAIQIYALENEGKVKKFDDLLAKDELGIAVKKGDEETLKFINDFLKEYKGSDQEKELKAKWFDNNDWLNNVDQPE